MQGHSRHTRSHAPRGVDCVSQQCEFGVEMTSDDGGDDRAGVDPATDADSRAKAGDVVFGDVNKSLAKVWASWH